jgi:hypothetical protein
MLSVFVCNLFANKLVASLEGPLRKLEKGLGFLRIAKDLCLWTPTKF